MVLTATMLCACAASDDEITLLVGTYTGAGSEGIYAYRFDQSSGSFLSDTAVGFARMANPSYLALSEKSVVYAVSEMADSTACVTSFEFDQASCSFTELSNVPSNGWGPCYISTNGELVAIGNYTQGNMALFPIAPDGSIMESTVSVQGAATGPDQRRQITPHMHCSVFSPCGKYLFASDFSADRIIRYEIATGNVSYFPVDRDSGPRHIVFSPNGWQMYVIGELSGDITVFDYILNEDGNFEGAQGELVRKQVINADRVNARGAADIHISPDGKFLYTSLRLENDGIAIFAVDGDGTLSEAGYVNTGKHPRNFTITPNGEYLLCACRDTDSIEVYKIDKATGLLEKSAASISLSKPVCLVWASVAYNE